jgi:hypothetical protein
VEDRLEGRAVDLEDLVEAVQEGIDGHRLAQGAPSRDLLKGCGYLRPQAQHLHGLPGLLFGHGGLAEQGGRQPDLVPPHRLGKGLKGETSPPLRLQDLCRRVGACHGVSPLHYPA